MNNQLDDFLFRGGSSLYGIPCPEESRRTAKLRAAWALYLLNSGRLNGGALHEELRDTLKQFINGEE